MLRFGAMRLLGWISLLGIFSGAFSQTPAPPSTVTGEWPTYGGDLFSSKYSPLDQLTPQTFPSLRVAWRAPSPDGVLTMTTADGGEWTASAGEVFAELSRVDPKRWRDNQPPIVGNFKATPLMVGGTLYFNTPLSIGAAVDAETGAHQVGLQPTQLRGRHDHDDAAVEPARRRLLERPRGFRRTHLLGHRRRLPDRRGREDRGSRFPASAPTAAWT